MLLVSIILNFGAGERQRQREAETQRQRETERKRQIETLKSIKTHHDTDPVTQENQSCEEKMHCSNCPPEGRKEGRKAGRKEGRKIIIFRIQV